MNPRSVPVRARSEDLASSEMNRRHSPFTRSARRPRS